MTYNPNSTRVSAIIQLVLGILFVIVGIIDKATGHRWQIFTAEALIAVWMGVWIIVTGIIGIAATNRRYGNAPNKALLGTFMGFSITSTVFAGVMIICYSIAIIVLLFHYYQKAKIAVASLILIFALIEFGITIWSAISCCLGYNCCGPPIQTTPDQLTYYIPAQGPGGVPVAVPVGNVPMPMTSQAVPQSVQSQAHMVYVASGVAGTNNPPPYSVTDQQQQQTQGDMVKVQL